MDWPPPCYQRAVAYVTDPLARLLVFDHVGHPGAGTQLPAGGVHEGEDHAAAVRRELAEESGITDAMLVRKLGESWFRAEEGRLPEGSEEQVHHAFHLHLAAPTPTPTWEWDECDGGEVAKWRYAFRWVEMESAAILLHPAQAMWLAAVRTSFASRGAV